MVISQGDVYWADLPARDDSAAACTRPVLVVQGNDLNQSRLATVLIVPLTSNLALAEAEGNVRLPVDETGLPLDSVALPCRIHAVDRRLLRDPTGRISEQALDAVFEGLDVVLGR